MRRSSIATLSLVAVVALAGCQADSSVLSPHDKNPNVVLATANFAEVEIVGHIVGSALSRSGSRVEVKSQAGDEGEVLAQLERGEATMTVGFTGALLSRYESGNQARTGEEVYAAMMAALPEGLTAADASPATDAPAYVVSKNTSDTLGLTSMSQLKGRCGALALGARPEVLADTALADSVGSVYECSFARRVPLGTNPRTVLDALRRGDVGVGVVQSSDPVLSVDDVVALKDDENAITAQQLVPILRKDSLSDSQLALVNRISGELTTADLRELSRGVEYGTATTADLANYWLDKNGY